MSSSPGQEPPAQGLQSGSGQMLSSQPLQPTSEPAASKRVCFYKSGDYKFSGHRMIVTARTFKTFDSLLDALSKKVPLPFGVRTISTPRGTHLVKALEDLQDGGAYVCSDQKRVKPLNLDEVNRRQVPWNATRPVSAGRRRRQELRLGLFGRRNDAANRPAKITERVAVRTPKKLEVLKNRDPSVKRTIVLQRRTAPTFDALLDYLSQILQFPVLKLYSTDGRRVDGLASLILCSGVVVAAGNEPFRLGNYNFHRTSQTAQILLVENMDPPTMQPRVQKNKSLSSGRRSRNFSLSSERFIVNQINESQNGSLNGYLHRPSGSVDAEARQRHSPLEMREAGLGDNEQNACTVPQDDDVEKSFRVNPDGSMTVEMKVRLTIKEEEMLYWTTTLSRSSLSKRIVCASGSNSPDANTPVAKDSSNLQEDNTQEENHHNGAVSYNESYTSTTLGKGKTRFKRTPSPGPRHVNKKASVENVKVVTGTEFQESTTGHYSYMERTEEGETTEEYCIVRHSSSSSNVPIPKPRRPASSGVSSKRSSVRTSEVAEVLQIQNDGMEVTETVMHIYESQGCYDNYVANEEYSADGAESKPSTDLRPRSSSNDCDIDCNWQPPTAESLQRQKEEMLSLSSEPESLAHQAPNNPSSMTESEAVNTQITEKVKTDNTPKSIKKKKTTNPAGNQRSSASTSSTDKKHKEISASKHSKTSSTDKLSSDASVGKKSLNSSGNSRSGLKTKEAELFKSIKSVKVEKLPKKNSTSLLHSGNGKISSPKRKNTNKAAAKDNGQNLNTPATRPQMKKNKSDILQTKKSPASSTRAINRPKSLNECRLSPPKLNVEVSKSDSIPSINPSPSEIHQYVENWLENVSPDLVPYTEEAVTDEAESKPKVVFKIGDDSESDEITERQTHLQTNLGDAMKKSTSCLSVPHFHEGLPSSLLHGEQRARGLCVSMPSVRADPVNPENRLGSHKSAEAIGPDDGETSLSNILSPKDTIKPVLRQLCSSIQCIRRVSTSDPTSPLHISSSLPSFSTQVASVFGSSCKAFLSFLSVVSLKDSLKGSASGEGNQSRTTSEAMLMMESLQKISVIEDEDEQRASLTDLHSRASSQFRARWKDFLLLRERLESEPLSPRVSETEFALDVVSEGGDLFEDQQLGIDELMDELNMPQDLREEIASTIHHTKCFYPVEESTFVETVKSQSDSEEDVEQFITEYKDRTKLSPELGSAAEDINDTKQGKNETDESQDEPIKTEEDEVEELIKSGDSESRKDMHDDEKKEKEESKQEEEKVGVDIKKEGKDEKQEDWEEEKSSDQDSVEKIEEGTEEYVTEDEEVIKNRLEEGGKSGNKGKYEESVDEETDTDEREGADETVEENSEDRDKDEEDEAETITDKGLEKGKDSCSEEVEENDEGGEQNDQDETDTLINEKEEEGEKSGSEDVEEEEHSVEEEEQQQQEEDNGAEVEGSCEDVEEEENSTEQPEENQSDNEDGRVETLINEREKEEEDSCHDDKEDDKTSAEEEYEEKQVCNVDGKAENTTNESEEEEQSLIQCAGEEVQEVTDDMKNVEEKHEEENVKENRETDEEAVEEAEDDVEALKKREGRHLTKSASEGNSNEDEEEASEQEEKNDTQNNTDEEKYDQTEDVQEKESAVEEEFDQPEIEENTTAVQTSRAENINQVETPLEDEAEDENVSEGSLVDENNKNTSGDVSLLQEHSSSCEEANKEPNTKSPSKCSSDGPCEDNKGTEAALETDEGGNEHTDKSNSLTHPLEISQELLDFVNDALQSYSLIFTYDPQGNVRLVPDNARVVQTKQSLIPRAKKDTNYGFKCLPSPITSDLSDYRPESSGSGGYKTEESVDIVSESGEESSQKVNSHSAHKTETIKVEQADSKLSAASSSETLHRSHIKRAGSFLSCAAASREDLSYVSAASSLDADAKAEAQNTRRCTPSALDKNSSDGVLIDRGRWLLKENHLIRKSPPVSLGMYGQLDSTSVDTALENTSEDSPPYTKTQHSPLAAISSSELEELAKPQNLKCTYFNMPHGSDSDPFLDDASIRSGKHNSGCVKGKGFRVSPNVDTSKTWANRNGSLSSFASVEFKVPAGKVHPEGEASAVRRTRRTSRGERGALQAQDSLESLHLRCGQYCPIL